jgi:hypothetical protein
MDKYEQKAPLVGRGVKPSKDNPQLYMIEETT